MNNKFLIGFIVLVAGLGVGWYVLQGGYQGGKAPTSIPTPTPEVSETITVPGEEISTATPGAGVAENGVMGKVIVTYTDSGFSPTTTTVKKGTTVTFTNQSGSGMRVASAVHPTHQLLPGFDQLQSVSRGGTYEYTFEKVGTWKYHNHVNPTNTGSVVVTEQ